MTGPISGPELPNELPADLQPGYVGPYRFPDTARRKIAAVTLAIPGVAAIAMWIAGRDGRLVSAGFLIGGIVLVVLAAAVLATAWPLRVDEIDALALAGRELGFALGPASASLAWRGWRSRPLWRIVVFSPEDPPEKRGLVVIDGVDGTVLLSYSEDNPER